VYRLSQKNVTTKNALRLLSAVLPSEQVISFRMPKVCASGSQMNEIHNWFRFEEQKKLVLDFVVQYSSCPWYGDYREVRCQVLRSTYGRRLAHLKMYTWRVVCIRSSKKVSLAQAWWGLRVQINMRTRSWVQFSSEMTLQVFENWTDRSTSRRPLLFLV
jgi:hypothetical protein